MCIRDRSHIDLSYSLGRGAEAQAHAESAVRVSTELTVQEPANKRFRARLGQSLFAEASVRVDSGDFSGGERSFARAGELFETALREDPEGKVAQRDVSLVNKRLGAIMLLQKRLPEAEARYERALAMDQKLSDRDPSSVQARFDLSVSHVELAGVRRESQDAQGAMAHLERALALRRQLVKEDPANAQARRALISVLYRIAGVHADLSDFGRSLEVLSEARGLLTKATTTAEKESLVGVLGRTAWAYRELKRASEACQAYREAVRVAAELVTDPAELETTTV